MAQLTQLVHPGASLHVGIISRPNGSHRGGLVAGVRLGAVLKVRVRPAGTVDADVAGVVDVRTSVGLAHDGHHGNSRGGANGLGTQLGKQRRLVLVRHCGDDVDQARLRIDAILLREITL